MKKQTARLLIVISGGVLLVCVWLFFAAGIYRQTHIFLPARMDRVPPALPHDLAPGSMLVFSKTNGFRHYDAIEAANTALSQFAAGLGRTVFLTENAAVFNTHLLSGFSVVIWNNASGDLLTNDQRNALRAFVESGGGFVGLHAAGDSSHQVWPWYQNELIRAKMTMHPVWQQFQQATLKVETSAHPATAGLPSSWSRNDEWYSFEASPRSRTNVLVSLDETSYDPERWPMGSDHPIVWFHTIGKGRIFYSAMGHSAAAYREPQHLKMLEGAIQWAIAEPGESER